MLIPANDAAPPPVAPELPALIDVELSALVYLLARCARDGTSAHQRLAVLHLEQIAANGMAPPVLRRTAGRLARQWRDELRTVDIKSRCKVHGAAKSRGRARTDGAIHV